VIRFSSSDSFYRWILQYSLLILVEYMKKMLILLEKGVEDAEFIYPYYRFQEEGYRMDIVAPRAKNQYVGKRGATFSSEFSPNEVNLDDYDAVVIPGGQAPDRMRIHPDMVELVRGANRKGKVVAAICHGPQMLIEADIVRGKMVTSWPSVRTDLRNAGARVVDEAAVVDGNIVTSRSPDDLPNFCRATINLLADNKKELV
jgi:protease I